MAIERLVVSRPDSAGAAEAEVSSRTRPMDLYGVEYQVPTGFAPQWLMLLRPLIPRLGEAFGSLFENVDTGSSAEAVMENARASIDVGAIIDLVTDPETWDETATILRNLVVAVFGAQQADQLLGMHPALAADEWLAIGQTLLGAWGVSLGEAWRRLSSSTAAGTTSKPISSGTATGSTPAKRSGRGGKAASR